MFFPPPVTIVTISWVKQPASYNYEKSRFILANLQLQTNLPHIAPALLCNSSWPDIKEQKTDENQMDELQLARKNAQDEFTHG